MKRGISAFNLARTMVEVICEGGCGAEEEELGDEPICAVLESPSVGKKNEGKVNCVNNDKGSFGD